MAIVVRDKKTDANYILLGAGFGAYATARPSLFFGNLLPREHYGEVELVAVCDGQGKIGFLDSDNIEVISVDGKSPRELL